MALTIVETAGASNANSFASEAEMALYMESRLNSSAWDSAGATSQRRALVEATRELSALGWKGERTSSTQALAWPRQWAPDIDNPTQGYYSSTVIPQRVKDAQMELAWQFVRAGTTDLASVDAGAGVTQKTVDVLSTSYDLNHRPMGLARFPRVLILVQPLLSAGTTTRVVRG